MFSLSLFLSLFIFLWYFSRVCLVAFVPERHSEGTNVALMMIEKPLGQGVVSVAGVIHFFVSFPSQLSCVYFEMTEAVTEDTEGSIRYHTKQKNGRKKDL